MVITGGVVCCCALDLGLLLQNLVAALADIAAALPDLLEDIQSQLLDLLSLILSGEGVTTVPVSDM
jgi:hypothetical protein